MIIMALKMTSVMIMVMVMTVIIVFTVTVIAMIAILMPTIMIMIIFHDRYDQRDDRVWPQLSGEILVDRSYDQWLEPALG